MNIGAYSERYSLIKLLFCAVVVILTALASPAMAADKDKPKPSGHGGEGIIQGDKCLKTNSELITEVCVRYKVSWKLWTLMGEPVGDYRLKWELLSYTIKINGNKSVNYNPASNKVALNFGGLMSPSELESAVKKIELYFDAEADVALGVTNRLGLPKHAFNTGVATHAGETSFNTPESPQWSKLFIKGRSTFGGEYLSEGEAKALFNKSHQPELPLELINLTIGPKSTVTELTALENRINKLCSEPKTASKYYFCPELKEKPKNDAKVDLLMDKIATSLKADNVAEALPYFAELEGMEPSLKSPLPESFYFSYIDTLEKNGNKKDALSRADAYLSKYGKNGKYYGKVTEIMSKLQKEAEKLDGMVLVKGGCFEMGDTFGNVEANEKPVHTVCVKDFYIGEHEVTQGEWKAVMGANPSFFSACGDDCPVERVSWNDIQGFIEKLNKKSGKNYRLPTEAEWEYAARSGGKEEKYAGTSSDSDVGQYAWYYDNSDKKTHPVKQKKPNGIGLHDMSGNVWELVSDCYYRAYYQHSPRDNPQGDSDCKSYSSRSLRGGSWDRAWTDIRVANRDGFAPVDRFNAYGFRLASSFFAQ